MIRGVRSLRPIAMIAVTAVVLTIVTIARRLDTVGSPVCPAQALCSTGEVPSAAALALATEACSDRLRNDWRALREDGSGTVALSITIEPRSGRTRVEPSALARRGLLRAAALAREVGLTLLVLIDATRSPDACRDPAVEDLQLWSRGEAADPSSETHGVIRVFCSSKQAPASGSAAAAEMLTTFSEVAVISEGRTQTPGATRNDSAPDAVAATVIEIPPDACIGSMRQVEDLVAGQRNLVGFVVAAHGDLLRNGDFRDGWNGWHTSGRLRLEAPAVESGATACERLIASLDPGASLMQKIRLPSGRARNLRLEIDVAPADVARPLLARISGEELQLTIPAHRSSAAYALPGTVEPLLRFEVAIPADARSDVAIHRLQLVAARDSRCADPNRIARDLASLVARRTKQPAAAVATVGSHGLEWGNAEVTAPPRSDLPPVQAVTLDTGMGRGGILAHPSPEHATTLTLPAPPMGCRRRFRSGAVIADSCRNVGDGVRFTARSRDREREHHVDVPASAAAPFPVELELDGDQSDITRHTEVVLSTEAGPAGDARCDWSVWVEPTVSCMDGDPAARATQRSDGTPARSIELKSSESARDVATRWDEINVWKLYTWFGPHRATAVAGSDRPGWLRQRIPWVTHARVMAALGGNSCRHIREQCRRGIESMDHPFLKRTWECVDGRADRSEILKEDDAGGWTIDLTDWDRAVDDLLASGLLPHFNISAAPCALTDGHAYRDYHWNQKPVRDHAAWLGLVDAASRSIANRPSASAWRFSVVNEPNCLWIAPGQAQSDGSAVDVYRLGFTGTSDQYAVQFAETAAALRENIPGIRLHLGNYTIGGKYPLEDTLPEYLGALPRRLAEHGLATRDFSAISFSLYESPQHRLADLATFKFARLAQAIGGDSPFVDLKVKVDEVEIHSLVAEEFLRSTGKDLDATRWAAAWHAEFLALAIQREVTSIAPWVGRLFSDQNLTQPHPKYWTYVLASLAMTDVMPDALPLREARALRAAATDSLRSRVRSVHMAADDRDGIGWLVTEAPDGTRYVMVWQHDEKPRTDEDASGDPARTVRIVARDACPPNTNARSAEVLFVDATDTTGEAVSWQLDLFTSSQARAVALPLVNGEAVIQVGSESVHLVRIACTN